MEQKLVSIFLLPAGGGNVTEHLTDYLRDGWRITRLHVNDGCPPGGRSDDSTTCIWIVAVLERAQV